MRLTDLIKFTSVDDSIEDISSIFGLTDEENSELRRVADTAIITTNSFTEAIRWIDKHVNLDSENHALMLLIHLGRARELGRVLTAIIQKSHHELLRMTIGQYSDIIINLQDKKLPVPPKLEKEIVSFIISAMLIINEREEVTVEKEDEHPMSNKNKFKKGDFDIPQP